jgi:hypothetical protein
MRRNIPAFLLLAAAALPLSAIAQSSLARFEGGIGVVPVRAGPAANVVNGVNPGGVPWVIERLSADIKTDGRISVSGRGLLLGGTNNIGMTGGNSVRARLFCGGVATADSDVALLEPNGDFRIDGTVTGTLPGECATPVLLIVSAANGNWFAAGIPKQ